MDKLFPNGMYPTVCDHCGKEEFWDSDEDAVDDGWSFKIDSEGHFIDMTCPQCNLTKMAAELLKEKYLDGCIIIGVNKEKVIYKSDCRNVEDRSILYGALGGLQEQLKY